MEFDDTYLREDFEHPETPLVFYLRKNNEYVREILGRTQSLATEGWVELCSTAESLLWSIRNQLENLREEMKETCQKKESAWGRHVQEMHFAKEALKMIRKTKQDPTLSIAYLKLTEILNYDPSLAHGVRRKKVPLFKTLHLCEAPGQFVLALDNFLGTYHPRINWKWTAASLNPQHELNSPEDMFLDDTLIVGNPSNWEFNSNERGDIFEFDVTPHPKYALVTADGSMYGRYNSDEDQEEMVLALLEREMCVATAKLSYGGTVVIKIYSMYTAKMRHFMKKWIKYFKEVYIFKPIGSNARTAERYLVLKHFNLITPKITNEPEIHDSLLYAAEIYFSQLRYHAIQFCLEIFHLSRKAKNRRVHEVKQKTLDVIFRKIRLENLIQIKRTWVKRVDRYPWIDMFGNNYVDELQKLKDCDVALAFICKTLIEEPVNNSPIAFKAQDLIVDSDFSECSDEKGYITAFAYGDYNPSMIAHSLFLPPLWLRSLLHVCKGVVCDLIGPHVGLITAVDSETDDFKISKVNYYYSQFTFGFEKSTQTGVLYLNSITSRQSLFASLLYIIENLNVQKAYHTIAIRWRGPGIPLILSRFSLSFIIFLSLYFQDVKLIGNYENGDLIRFENEFDNKATPNVLETLKTVLKKNVAENLTRFVPLSTMAAVHDIVVRFNKKQWLKIAESIKDSSKLDRRKPNCSSSLV